MPVQTVIQPSGNDKCVQLRSPNSPSISLNPVLGYVYIDTNCVKKLANQIVFLNAPTRVAQVYNNVMNRLLP